MPQSSLSSEVSDVHPAHHDSKESADPLLGVMKLKLEIIFSKRPSPSESLGIRQHVYVTEQVIKSVRQIKRRNNLQSKMF